MRQVTQLVCLASALLLCSGCASLVESMFESAINTACGENEQERRDREKMEEYRKTWATPGRTPYEIEVESRGTFHKVHGREPSLNWHAR